PLLAGVALPDPVAGATAALATLAALRWRERSGHGLRVEVAQWEAALQLVGPWLIAGVPAPRSPADLDPPAAPRGVYPCRGRDTWLALTVESDAEWASLCSALGAPDLAADPRFASAADRAQHGAALEVALAARTRLCNRFALAAKLQRAGVAAGVVRRPADVARDAQLDARGFFLKISHREAGTHRYPGVPWRCDVWPAPPRAPAPCFGAHNAAVLRDWLGLDAADVARLLADGALAAAPRV
ncbi:MAG: CoA transferase, partial [Chloroflexi bacterium]|nr:CoA transferase [Chloroflexota bacterium]